MCHLRELMASHPFKPFLWNGHDPALFSEATTGGRIELPPAFRMEITNGR
jgi:hypothetical protein